MIKINSGEEFKIERINIKFRLDDNIHILWKQFPITFSYAITIHKSQGLSLEEVIVDLGNTVRNSGQAYVALSRVTTLKGLTLINFDPTSIRADSKAINEYERLKRLAKLKINITNGNNYIPTVSDNIWCIPKIINNT